MDLWILLSPQHPPHPSPKTALPKRWDESGPKLLREAVDLSSRRTCSGPASSLISRAIWLASSRVGETMQARKPLAAGLPSAAITGMENASVLPEP